MRKKSFERRVDALASRREYIRRMIESGVTAGAIILGSWLAGAAGYRYIAGLKTWVDSFYNAAMILGGMGPVDTVTLPAGKWFASFYALYSGVVLLTSVGIFISPAVHRFLHRFHLETAHDS